MNDVKSAWRRIKRWYKDNVPAEHFDLQPGASAAEIKAAEGELGVAFPKGVKELYRLNNGSASSGVFERGFSLASLANVVTNWNMWREHLEQGLYGGAKPKDLKGPIKKVWWNLKWIPITHNDTGDHQIVDLDPDKGGEVGQMIDFGHEVGPKRVLANNLESWLTAFADALEKGTFRFDMEGLWIVPTVKKRNS